MNVRALDVDGNELDKTYKLYDYIQAELTRGDDRYVLSAGRWFRVAKDYIEYVNQQLATVEEITVDEAGQPGAR